MATSTSTPTLSKAESRRLYSWWWDSHIPKNSKWLQENLTDMDMRVKAMIKLIEEDADSFARRAEMYYKKRPELMKLVEEFYRAYRALAERYDHATGALRQAQKTMAEAFPNQIPFALADESPSESSASELEPYTPAVLPPTDTVFGNRVSQKDASGASASSSGERNGTYTDEADVQSRRKVLKHFTEIFSDGGTRKGLTFQEEDKKGYGNETRAGQKGRNIGADEEKARKLQEELSQLSAENQNLKDQISTESKDKSKAENELQWLQRAHTKLESEKEEALLQFQQSLRKIASLEAEIEKFRAQNAEVLIKISKLDSAEEKCQLLEKEKQSIMLTTGELEKKTNEQEEELMHMQDELEKLKIVLKDEHMRCVHTEAALASLEALHSQSVEALRISALEIEKGVQLLKETDAKRESLKEELEKVKEEIQNLNHENVSSQEMIKTLQDQISILKEEKKNLENEVEHQGCVKKSLDEELDHLKEEIHDLQDSHKGITDQIEAVGLHEVSFQESVMELQNANLKLRDMCMKKEDENVLLLEKLKQMQEITEKNTLLENSLSDANVELENLGLKIKELVESCERLQEKSSTLELEKKELVSLVDTVTSNIEELTERNTSLENSLSEAVFELEGLRVTLKSLEESCQSLEDDKSKLQIEKDSLISQVGLMGNNLEDLGNRFSELQELHSNLEREKETKDGQLAVLQDLFKLQKQQYETLVHTSNARLAGLEDEISRLHDKDEHREELFQDEQLKLFAAEFEILIIRRCLYDLRDKNLRLSKEWQKMEQYILEQKEKEALLLDHIGRLKKVMHMIWKALNTNEECRIADGAEQLYLQYILDRIEAMQNSVRSVEDEKQSLLLEKSVYITLLQQLGHHITDLRLEKNDLYQDCRKKAEELLLLQSERSELFKMNKQLTNVSEAGQQREEMLEEEMKILGRKVLDLQEAHSLSQDENQKLLDENEQLSRRFSNLKEDIHLLEEEYTAIFRRATVLDCLSVIFEQFGSQRIDDLKILNDDFDQSKRSKDHLEYKVMEMGEKMQVVEVENFHLKNLAVKLEECREHLTILAVDMSMARTVNEELIGQIQQLDQLIENRNYLLKQKDVVLSEVDQSFQDLRNQNTRLHEMLEAMKLELGEVKVVRDELEKKIVIFVKTMADKDKEISLALHANVIMREELQRLDKENESLRTKEKELAVMWLNEVSCCEEEFAALCSDIQIANVHAVLFEEKVLELMRVCESLETRNLVEMEASFDELLSKGVQIEELKVKLDSIAEKNREMKSELNEYTSIVSSLGNGISSLEDLILPLRKALPSDRPNLQDQESGDGDKGIEGSEEDMRCERPQGILELQNLLVKVEAIREVLMEAGIPIVPDNLGGTGSERGKVLGSTTDSRKSTGKDEEMKDIQLDQVSSSSKFDFDDGAYGIGNADSIIVDDQMLRLWDEDYNDKSYGFEVGAQKDRHPSYERELGVDKLLPRKKVKDSSQEWNKEVIERLSSDAGRLNVLHEGIQELKIKTEKSEDTNLPKSFEFETVKMQLKDAEATILHLMETNGKLIRKAQVCSTSSVSSIEDQDETKNEKKKVSERARRGSDKIARLELELQKLQYILLKLEEEYENHRARAAERKSRVVLRDYLYGRRDRRRRRGHFCGCIGSTASDD